MGAIKLFTITTIICIFFIYGCENGITGPRLAEEITGEAILDLNNNISPESTGETPENTIEENTKELRKNEPKDTSIEKEAAYNSDKLIADLKEILDASHYGFERDPTHRDYIRSSDLKYYVIHTNPGKKINNFNEFCDEYCAENWNGRWYYTNRSDFNSYFQLPDKSNFSTEGEYNDYFKNRILANHTVMEKVYDLEHGKVIEYRFFFVEQDDIGNFKGNLLPYLLIYKIPCTSDMTVFIRPKWQDFTVYGLIGKVPVVIDNWIREDNRVKEELLEKADEILEACPLEKGFFDSYDQENYFKSELLVAYWKIYQTYFMNLSREITIGVEKTKHGDIYTLSEVNLTFTNYDDFSLEDVGLKITILKDGEKNEILYFETDGGYSRINPGNMVKRSVKKDKIRFNNNITVRASLFHDLEDVEVRPLEVTFTKEDFK